MPEITRKPTARQIEVLRSGAADKRGIVDVTADKRTREGLVGRDLADWMEGTKLGLRSVTAYCVITQAGLDYLAQLDGAPATGVEGITRADVAQGVEAAMQWLPYGEHEEARTKPASAVLAAEFKRSGAIMRRVLKKRQGPQIETQCVEYYSRVTKLLQAARRFEAQDAEEQPVIVTPDAERLNASDYEHTFRAGVHVARLNGYMVRIGVREDGSARRVHGAACTACGASGTTAELERQRCTEAAEAEIERLRDISRATTSEGRREAVRAATMRQF